jgi:hypothetical protein
VRNPLASISLPSERVACQGVSGRGDLANIDMNDLGSDQLDISAWELFGILIWQSDVAVRLFCIIFVIITFSRLRIHADLQ